MFFLSFLKCARRRNEKKTGNLNGGLHDSQKKFMHVRA